MNKSNTDEWWLQAVRYFRAMGFFARYHDLSDAELVSTLQRRYIDGYGEALNIDDPWADLHLLGDEHTRVWWMDTEADVCRENHVYVESLQEWSAISRGAFHPENIRETWKSDAGPIEVTFDYQGQPVMLRPAYDGDWMDLHILARINRAITSTGMQFALYEQFDQTGFILVLTAAEKDRLHNERGWVFAHLQ